MTTTFLYDGLNIVQELNGTTPVANLLTGLGVDEVFTRTEAASTRTFFTDGLGSTLALNGPTSSTQYTYEPFGKTIVTGASSTNSFQYTGRENDGTGLYYYRARYYHPGLQRFVSQDPIGFMSGDFNLYGYVTNNPLTFTDPDGLHFLPPPPGYPPDACRRHRDLPGGGSDWDPGCDCFGNCPPPHPPLWPLICRPCVSVPCTLICTWITGMGLTCRVACREAGDLVCPKGAE